MDLKSVFGLEGKDSMKSLINTITTEMGLARKASFGQLKLSDSEAYQKLKSGSAQDRANLARYMATNASSIFSSGMAFENPRMVLFSGLLRATLPIPPDELLNWCMGIKSASDAVAARRAVYFEQKPNGQAGSFFITQSVDGSSSEPEFLDGNWPKGLSVPDWPIGFMIQQVERNAAKEPLSQHSLDCLRDMLTWPEMVCEPGYYGTDMRKVAKRIEGILFAAEQQAGKPPRPQPYKKLGGDNFGDPLKAQLCALRDDDADRWHLLMGHAGGATASKPSKQFLTVSTQLREELGKEWLRRHLHDWLAHAVSTSPSETARRYQVRAQIHEFVETVLFTKSNTTLLKGLVWTAFGFKDARTVHLIADLCEKTWDNQVAIANACLWYLGETSGIEAMTRLSRLSSAIKSKSVRKKIAELIAVKAAAVGITPLQLEERSISDYGLENGEKIVVFGDFALQIRAEGAGRVQQTWFKHDGSTLKSKPKAITEGAALKKRYDHTKAEIVALRKALTAQRDRIDTLFIENLRWPLHDIETHYIGHPLVGVLAKRLIWVLDDEGSRVAALWRQGRWEDIAGQQLAPSLTSLVSLWHPVDVDVDETIAWRARLAALDIVQPMKQAHREVYVLTDAERSTRSYSNRMAAHMLKQHQMARLMASRGWDYRLIGCYDDGIDDQWARRKFTTSDITAEYLIRSNWDEDNYNDAGIYHYVGTDQLRFTRPDTTQEPLERIPQRILSEVMRDADLFVGVASVGNDPSWIDQGPTPQARQYWQGYSFGDLDGFAQTRRDILAALIPRLKLRDVAHIDGRFLIVDGKLNTYKIHLGSSNILMAPGDRYLCIVPGMMSKAGDVALPFEGDARLSVILSKALMLADDDKIVASDIVSQLKRGGL